jgi:hypothetical protein
MGADFPVLPRINPTRGAGEVRNPELEEIKVRIASKFLWTAQSYIKVQKEGRPLLNVDLTSKTKEWDRKCKPTIQR